MGWFGEGNFDNDRALDYLGDEVFDPLWEKVAQLLDDPDSAADPNEPDSDEIVAAVELLALICENTPAVPPPTASVERCRDNFLRVWTGAMQTWVDSGESSRPNPDYVKRRRAVMERTIDRLLRACRQADAQGLERDQTM